MRKVLFLVALFSAGLSLPGFALAAPVPIRVHNTGVNSSDVLVSVGQQAAFWTLSAKPVSAVEAIGSNPFRYDNINYANASPAAWVAPQSDGNAGALGLYTYDLEIDLSGLDPASALITGTFGTDNEGAIWLNSNAPVATKGYSDYGVATPFTINGGFVSGLNRIHVQVNNAGDPTAFFVSFTSASANATAPVPAMSWPALAGLALLLAGLGSVLSKKARSL